MTKLIQIIEEFNEILGSKINIQKINRLGTSLVVQWIGIQLPMQWTQV